MSKSNSSSTTKMQPLSKPSHFEGVEVKTDATEPTADELGRLRDILFGSQSRTLEKRLSDLETDLRSLRQEMTNLLQNQISTLSESNNAQFVETRREFNEKLNKQSKDQSAQQRAAQKDLSERLDKLDAEQVERTRNLQSEARQRDDNLRQELLSMTASLDNKKISRQDLGQMLMELGLRLRQESENS
jgi:hypothetical protein